MKLKSVKKRENVITTYLNYMKRIDDSFDNEPQAIVISKIYVLSGII